MQSSQPHLKEIDWSNNDQLNIAYAKPRQEDVSPRVRAGEGGGEPQGSGSDKAALLDILMKRKAEIMALEEQIAALDGSSSQRVSAIPVAPYAPVSPWVSSPSSVAARNSLDGSVREARSFEQRSSIPEGNDTMYSNISPSYLSASLSKQSPAPRYVESWEDHPASIQQRAAAVVDSNILSEDSHWREEGGDPANPLCECGAPTARLVSRTSNNMNREFFGCSYGKESGMVLHLL
jgi:hypothetical protein